MKIISEFFKQNRYKHIIALIRKNWLKLAVAMGCMMVVSWTTAVLAFLIKNILDDIFIAKDEMMLTLIPVVVIATSFLRGFAVLGKEYLMNHVGQSIVMTLRNDLYDKIQDLSLTFFQKEKTGGLMSRITYDVSVIKAMVSNVVTGAIEHCFSIVGLTVVVFYRDWKMAIMAFVVVPLAFLPIVQLGRRIRKVSTGTQESVAEMNSFLHETFAGNRIVKAFGREDYEKKRFFKKSYELFRYEMKKVKAQALSSPIMDVCGGLGIAFIVWYGGHGVVTGASTTGTFFSFLTAVFLLYEPFKKLTKLNNVVQEGLAAVDRVFDIIETQSEIVDPVNPQTITPGNHIIEFDHVTFSYDEATVLDEVCIKANPGEVIALVGMSGGGKSTLVNLIPRFYDVSSGSILIDGMDIRLASLSSLREQIAMVTQDAILFNDSIRNNIAYGNHNASDEEIMNAARAAFAYDFVQKFPQGFETTIGELGNRLSGGEKQRICIARALLKNTPILLLDEATSALDAEAEKVVQRALENLMKGRTTFVIAHRLSTITYADRIIVLARGRIVEEGTHDELLARGGEYFKLYTMHFEDKEEKIQD
ncbi:MAG: ABC transporter ATP-binding protein/permease [Proteobacteria bacterium]|nr:ABC transporter ATP-binding protein/permease [Pseudomonadota bacterium]